MRLRGMDEERVAEIDRPGISGRQHFGPARRFGEAIGRELAQRQAGLARRSEDAGDVDCRILTTRAANSLVIFHDPEGAAGPPAGHPGIIEAVGPAGIEPTTSTV